MTSASSMMVSRFLCCDCEEDDGTELAIILGILYGSIGLCVLAGAVYSCRKHFRSKENIEEQLVRNLSSRGRIKCKRGASPKEKSRILLRYVNGTEGATVGTAIPAADGTPPEHPAAAVPDVESLTSSEGSSLGKSTDGDLDGDAFSCDLVEESQKHLQFLKDMHEIGVTNPDNYITDNQQRVALKHYRYWLSQVAEDPDKASCLPPQAAYLWHCHRLAPKRYEEYCTLHFGRVLEAAPFEYNSVGDLLAPAWTYKDKSENFLGVDLIGSAKRQGEFLWHVLGPQYQNEMFLQQAVRNYHRFLKLRRVADANGPSSWLPSFQHQEAELTLVPTYQIDFMWHTHMLVSTTEYASDCHEIRGRYLDHDDSLNDRAPGAKLDLSFQETSDLWEETYGCPYAVNGGMYRGPPPGSFWLKSDASFAVATPDENADMHGDYEGPWLCTGEPGSFIRGERRSKEPGVNNNPAKEGFIFGRGSLGIGYYSFKTRESFCILYQRFRMLQLPCFYVGLLRKRERRRILSYMVAFVQASYLSPSRRFWFSKQELLEVDPSLPEDDRFEGGVKFDDIFNHWHFYNIHEAKRDIGLGAAGCGTCPNSSSGGGGGCGGGGCGGGGGC